MAAWFNSDNIVDWQVIMSLGYSGDNNNMILLHCRGNVGGDPLQAYTYDGATYAIASTTTGYSANTWHHAALVQAASNDHAVYIDGGSKGTAAQDSSPANIDSTGISVRATSALGREISGMVAEAAIWNAALTDAEIAALYCNGIGTDPRTVRPGNLVAYWPLTGHDNDLVGGYHLTPYNSPTWAQGPFELTSPGDPLPYFTRRTVPSRRRTEMAEAARMRGLMFSERGDFGQALTDFEKALRLASDDWEHRPQVEADVAALRTWKAEGAKAK